MITRESLRALVQRFHSVHAYVVGDAMLDRYWFGSVTRICPEAPVPVFVPEREEDRPGGAANVVQQLGVLGCKLRANFGPRSMKLRLLAERQQLVRVDYDASQVPTEAEVAAACVEFREGGFDVLVLSDYAKGWLSFAMCQALIAAAREKGTPIVIDPKGRDWSRYAGATVITPNGREHGIASSAMFADSWLVEKCGARGMWVWAPQHEERYADYRPVRNGTEIAARARHVFDVTGAGDTVTALLAATLAVGGTVLDGAHLATVAAGYVVGEVGTSVCSVEQLHAELDTYDPTAQGGATRGDT
jgi:D-beta-D-heptose 7-phosphate kinase / D-beta-D-heptose 1-phosphate adenosyltransferase